MAVLVCLSNAQANTAAAPAAVKPTNVISRDAMGRPCTAGHYGCVTRYDFSDLRNLPEV